MTIKSCSLTTKDGKVIKYESFDNQGAVNAQKFYLQLVTSSKNVSSSPT